MSTLIKPASLPAGGQGETRKRACPLASIERHVLEAHDILQTAEAGELPDEIMISPWGRVESTSGNFIMDDQAAAEIVRNFRERKNDLPIDYEHQSLGGELSSPSGTAPAAGWIKELMVRPDEGLFARVDWTERAADMLRAKEYRYISPVVYIRKMDNRALALHSAALTNTPAIAGIQAIVNAAGDLAFGEEIWERLTYLLNVPTTATKGEIMIELDKLLAQLRELAGAESNTDAPAVLKALKAKLEIGARNGEQASLLAGLVSKICKTIGVEKPDDERAIEAKLLQLSKPPAHSDEEFQKLVNRVAELETEQANLLAGKARREAEALVEQAFKVGKLTDPQRDWALEFARKDAEGFKQFVERAPVVVSTGRIEAPGSQAGSTVGAIREQVINKAAREWDEKTELQVFCTRQGHINLALRDANLPRLDDEEGKNLGKAA